MKIIENECVNCPQEMGCLDVSCPYKNVTRYYCDICGCEETLYFYDGEEICKYCLLKNFDIIEGSDW